MKTLVKGFLLAGLLASPTISYGEENVPNDALILLPVQNDPTVSVRLWFMVGSQNDPAGKEGLAAITAAMLTDASTQKHRYEEILDLLFPLASGYSASTSVEMTIISGRTHKDNVKEYYPLLMEAVLMPAFTPTDLERIKSQVVNYLENELRYSSDEELGKAMLYTAVYAGTPYGHITEGTIAGVKSITVEDVRSFYRTHYTRENLRIGLGGGYDDAFVAQIRRDLGALPSGAPTAVPKPDPAPKRGFHVTIVEKDAPATAISMGFPIALLRGSKDWYALAVANSWLGEHRNSSSHLYQVIREARGLNYGDYSYIEHFPNGGRLQMPPQNAARRSQLFEIWIRPVPNETRHFALRAALREFKKLMDNGMTEQEFQLTRGFLRKYVLHYAPTTMERLGYAIDDRFYMIAGSHLENFRKVMGEITLQDVNAAIRKYWRYGDMTVAIVTKDAAALKEALVRELPSPITYSSPKPEAVLKEDREISMFPLNVEEGNVSIVNVKDLFTK
jgi:zinc protease